MQIRCSKKNNPIQKSAEHSVRSILDSSSQSESLQRKADLANGSVQREERPNNTGMPDNLKSGIESLSGFSMDNVRVHYNSSKPATVQALAYTQGTDIHVAPGQEKCLPHEAWHVAQQMAGRVSPTTNINGMPVNDNAALEHEADVMGEKAVRCKENGNRTGVLKNVTLKTGNVQRMPTRELIGNNGDEKELKGIKYKIEYSSSNILQNPTFWFQDYLGQDEVVRITIQGAFNDKIESLQAMALLARSLAEKSKDQMDGADSFYADIIAPRVTEHSNTTFLLLRFKITNAGIFGADDGPGYVVGVLKKRFQGTIVTSETPILTTRRSLIGREREGANTFCSLHDDSLTYLKSEKRGRKGLRSLLGETRTDQVRGGKKPRRQNKSKKMFKGDFLKAVKWAKMPIISKTGKAVHLSTLPQESQSFKSGVIPDAYAKLVAEGARFEFVRENMKCISDSTVFYAEILDRNKFLLKKGVDYPTLWKSWSGTFGCSYGVTAKDCVEKLATTPSFGVYYDTIPDNAIRLGVWDESQKSKKIDCDRRKLTSRRRDHDMAIFIPQPTCDKIVEFATYLKTRLSEDEMNKLIQELQKN